MSTITLTPTDDDDSRRFTELVVEFEESPPRTSTRTVVLPDRDATDQGLRSRRHRYGRAI